MGLSDYLLYRVARAWPSPMKQMTERLGAEPGSDAYNMAYANRQFEERVAKGMRRPVTGMEVLEIGTGHGGIACFMAAVGAKRVVAIDLNTKHLHIARRYLEIASARYGDGFRLPVEFLEMNANRLGFADQTFDLVLADNVFEHFTDPEGVMREVFRVLRPGGGLLVPIFSSIYSKYGTHIKHGLKVPWTNLVFSEPTICRALARMAQENPGLYEIYPGLHNNPRRVRDLRRYGDLNDITYSKFKKMAKRVGYRVESFAPIANRTVVSFVSKTPVLRDTRLSDVFSLGASSFLVKPGTRGSNGA